MAVKKYQILVCDRKSCKKEFEDTRLPRYQDLHLVEHIKYMKTRNHSGSADSNMDKILCPDCSKEFLKFMEG